MMPSPIILMPVLQENVIQKIWECCCKSGKVLFERETRHPLDAVRALIATVLFLASDR